VACHRIVIPQDAPFLGFWVGSCRLPGEQSWA